jgi:4-hydroxybenzoate polyprenyltransferase
MTEALIVSKPPLALAAVKALRIKQWTKNGVLFVPLLFAKGVVREGLPLKSLVAVASFSLLASGVYLVNDWADKEKDRHHPEKRHRPIAAGLLSLPVVLMLVALCWGGAAALGAWLGTSFLAVCGAYLVLQALYTWALKKAVILDVMAIALGFILRVVAGAVAINVMVSNWLFLCTLLGALFLGFAKRRHELSSLAGDASSHRANLEDYSLPMLDQMMSIAGASTILAYGLYTVSPETVDHVGSDKLKFTVPLVIYGVLRYLFLVHKRGAGGSPEKVLLSDAPLIVDIGLIIAIAAWVLYAPNLF